MSILEAAREALDQRALGFTRHCPRITAKRAQHLQAYITWLEHIKEYPDTEETYEVFLI